MTSIIFVFLLNFLVQALHASITQFSLSDFKFFGKQYVLQPSWLCETSDELHRSWLVISYGKRSRPFPTGRHLVISHLITHLFLLNTTTKKLIRKTNFIPRVFAQKNYLWKLLFSSWSRKSSEENSTDKNIIVLYFFTGENDSVPTNLNFNTVGF